MKSMVLIQIFFKILVKIDQKLFKNVSKWSQTAFGVHLVLGNLTGDSSNSKTRSKSDPKLIKNGIKIEKYRFENP
mgnify:CR=1 FL=1